MVFLFSDILTLCKSVDDEEEDEFLNGRRASSSKGYVVFRQGLIESMDGLTEKVDVEVRAMLESPREAGNVILWALFESDDALLLAGFKGPIVAANVLLFATFDSPTEAWKVVD